MTEANHATESKVGGRGGWERQRFELDLVADRGAADIVLSPRIPKTRAECIHGTAVTGSQAERVTGHRLCGAVGCAYNLYYLAGEDRCGRRHPNGRPQDTVEIPTRASCALDYTDEPQQPAAIATLLGLTSRRVEQLVRRALLKLAVAGVRLDEFLAMLESEGRATNLYRARELATGNIGTGKAGYRAEKGRRRPWSAPARIPPRP